MLLSLENIDAYQKLFGMNDRNMAVLEQELSVVSALRGQELQFRGDAENVAAAETAVARLITLLQHGETVDPMRIRYVVSLVREGKSDLLDQLSGSDVIALTHRGRPIRSKTLGQRAYVEAVRKHELTLAVGPAGTGKTYLAMAMAVVALKAKEVERIVLTRPAVEAGEKLGFLPGDMTQKVDPYLRPLYDALHELMGADSYQRLAERGTVEVAPLAFMRGRTLSDAFIILDEAQNATSEQMKMFLTRLGFGSKIVITGDITQIDLPDDKTSGLKDAIRVLDGVKDIAICRLTSADVVRHALVQEIISAYERAAQKQEEKKNPREFKGQFQRKRT